MNIEQHRRALNWADQNPFSTPWWALAAAVAYTVAMLITLGAGERVSQRQVEPMPQVIELQRVVITAQHGDAGGRQRSATVASQPQSVMR